MDQQIIDIVNTDVLPCLPPDQKSLGILTILEIAAAIIDLFQRCPHMASILEQDAEKALHLLRKPTIVNKARLYLAVRRQCKKNHTEEDIAILVNACLKAGEKATADNIKTILSVSRPKVDS